MEATAPMYPEVPNFEFDKTTFINKDPDTDIFGKPISRKKSNGGNEFRMAEINRIRNKLEKHVETRKKLSKHYKRLFNVLYAISVGSTSVTTVVSSVTLGMLANPVILLPLAAVNAGLGATSVATNVWSKLINKRIQKHQKLYLLANSYLHQVNSLVSIALKDHHISNTEFSQILAIHQEFLFECRNLKDVYSKKTLVEIDQIKNKINKALSS